MPHESAPLLSSGLSWLAQGHRVAIATVVKTWGSSPRPPGSLLVICETGDFVGSVSGGCIEGAVITAAQVTMTGGQPQLLSFGVTQELAWEVGLACGGRVEVWVERADLGLLTRLHRALLAREPLVVVTAIPSGEKLLLTGPSDPACPESLRSQVQEVMHGDSPLDHELPDGRRYFLWPLLPAVRLLIVGAVHIAQSLAQLAAQCDLDVTVVDPRAAFASESRFPSVQIIKAWPEEALVGLAIDRRTAVVTLTHDPKLDDPALWAALHSEAFYVGALGSGKTHAARLRRLGERGLAPEQLARIHGPVGLRIGARSPAEIAVSILGQLISVLRRENA